MKEFCFPSFEVRYFQSSSMATEGTDAARFDPEASRPAMDNSFLIQKPKPQLKMSLKIPVTHDGEFAVNRQGQLSVKKARALHIQVMRVRQEDQYLREDLRERLNLSDAIAFLPISSHIKDVFFRYSRSTFPSPLGIKGGVRAL